MNLIKSYRKLYINTVVPDGSPTNNDNNNLYDLVSKLPAGSMALINSLKASSAESRLKMELTLKNHQRPKTCRYRGRTNKELGYHFSAQAAKRRGPAVAFEIHLNGRRYKSREPSEDYSNKGTKDVVFLKMLRPRKIATKDATEKFFPPGT